MKQKKSKITNEQLTRESKNLYPIIEPVITASGFRLVEISFVSENEVNYLRITILHPDHSITVDDCEFISRTVEKELDSKGNIPFSYLLEVQSPGTDNELMDESRHTFTLKDLGLVIKS